MSATDADDEEQICWGETARVTFAVVIAAIGQFMASLDRAEIAQCRRNLVCACVCFVAGAIAIRIAATSTAVPETSLGRRQAVKAAAARD